MRLEITYEDESIDRKFANYIKDIIKGYVRTKMDVKKLIVWDEYLNEEGVLTFTYRKSITAKEIILAGINNLTVYSVPNKFLIYINPNVFMDGLNMTKVTTLCRLINYGNASMKGYPIFSNAFQDVENNFNEYLQAYFLTHKEEL